MKWMKVVIVALTLWIASLAQTQIDRGQVPKPAIKVIDQLDIDVNGKSVSNLVLDWRAKNQVVSFRFRPFSHLAPTKARAVVWVLGNPGETPQVPGAKLNKPTNIGVIAHIQDLGIVKDAVNFKIDFSEFAPYGQYLPMTLTLSTGNSASQAMKEKIKRDTLQKIGRDGKVTYYVQVTTDDGAASTTPSVNYGEILNSTAETKLEYRTARGTPEFPEDKWGTQGTVSTSSNYAVFRWTPPAGTAYGEVIIRSGHTSEPWAFWALKSHVIRKSFKVDSTKESTFQVETAELLKSPNDTKFIATISPLNGSGHLVAKPSNPIYLNVWKEAVVAPIPKLTFTTELVGWSRGYEGDSSDPHRYVVSDPKFVTMEELKKIIGGPAVIGTKVYLPPAPPPKEKAWYEKFVGAIATVLDYIRFAYSTIVQGMSLVVDTLWQLPLKLTTYVGVPEKDVRSAINTISKTKELAQAPLQVASRVRSAPGYFTALTLDELGVKDYKTRAAIQGDLVGAFIAWGSSNEYVRSSPNALGLSPDPDFEVRTGVAYVRVTAKADGKLPEGFRAKGPTISLEVGNFAKNSSLLGAKDDYYIIYTGTAASPTFAAGESIIVPVITTYHWSHDKRPDDWKFAWYNSTKTRYTVNGKAQFGESMHNDWGAGKKK